MKKILFILISIPFLFLVACTGEEKEIYSGNSNERLTEQDLEKVLISMFNNEKGIFAPYHVNAFGWAGLPC